MVYLVYFKENPNLKWMIWRYPHDFGNLHIYGSAQPSQRGAVFLGIGAEVMAGCAAHLEGTLVRHTMVSYIVLDEVLRLYYYQSHKYSTLYYI